MSKEKTKHAKHSKNKKKINLKRLVYLIILLVFIALMFFSGYKIIRWIIENKKSTTILKDVKQTIIVDENDKYTVDFAKLKDINQDTVGWIRVPGTEVDYPVVKTTNNDYYINHSFDKTYNGAGWIFMDYKNSSELKDKNTVIYGHNRKNDSMFGTLKYVLNANWYNNDENKYVHYITEDEDIKYEVFSVYKIEVEDYYITTSFNTTKDYEHFINTIKSRSVKDFAVNVTTMDKILTLSTCADNNNYRVVLHAKRVAE